MNASLQQSPFGEGLQYQEVSEMSETKAEFNISEPLQYQDTSADNWITAGPQVKRILKFDYEPDSKRVARDIDSLPTLIQNNAFYTSNCDENMEGISEPSGIDEFSDFKTNSNNLDPEYIEDTNSVINIVILIPRYAFINMKGQEHIMMKLIGRESQTEIFLGYLSEDKANKVSRETLFLAKTQPYIIYGERKNVEHAVNWIKNWLSSYTRKAYFSKCISDFDI